MIVISLKKNCLAMMTLLCFLCIKNTKHISHHNVLLTHLCSLTWNKHSHLCTWTKKTPDSCELQKSKFTVGSKSCLVSVDGSSLQYSCTVGDCFLFYSTVGLFQKHNKQQKVPRKSELILIRIKLGWDLQWQNISDLSVHTIKVTKQPGL